MFSLKINSFPFQLTNAVARTCRYNKQCVSYTEHLQTLCISTGKGNESIKHGSLLNITSLSHSQGNFHSRTFSNEALPKHPDVFGDIGRRKYDQVELDDIEQKVEEFDENEAQPFRRYRKTPGQYAAMIKTHIQNGDLYSAENVLQIAKENRDKPTLYMFNLIIRAFALHGDVKKCFGLYNKLLKRGMKPNDATITSLFNACSNSLDDIKSLEALHNLRSYLHEKNYELNETHYNALIKAYARHRQIEEAFQMLDRMRDKQLNIDEITFNNLLHGASTQKEIGIKYALVVWHLMKFRKIKPSISTYNLLFRVIRDTEIGDLKINDVLLPGADQTKICMSDGERPDLLATPPVVRPVPKVDLLPQTKSNLKYQKKQKEIRYSSTAIQSSSEQESSHDDLLDVPLNDIVRQNRLILFGGFDGLMKRMEEDEVTPDRKSLSICLELIPNTKEAEKHVISYARKKKILLDTGFFNVLIKRRCFRFDYEDAKSVLADMEKCGAKPDIFTWGVIALACQTPDDGRSLLECLDSNGIIPNYFIYGALFRYATSELKTEYVIELMESMRRQEVKPSNEIYKMLDKFKDLATTAVKEKKSIRDPERFQIELTKFKLRYSSFQKSMKRNNIISKSSSD